MARMRTLGEIVKYFGTASAPADLVGLMLSVVAEKTGYPVEMIELTQDLESDLGIDSIKRVEILAAVRDREPTLPSVDPGLKSGYGKLGADDGSLVQSCQPAGTISRNIAASLSVGLTLACYKSPLEWTAKRAPNRSLPSAQFSSHQHDVFEMRCKIG